MDRICTFTGNRPIKLPWGYDERDERCRVVKQRILDEVRRAIDDGFTRFVCGMALGGDFYFAEAILSLKDTHNITLECAVPYKGQADKWSSEFRARYDDILSKADEITVLGEHYTSYCMHLRNKYMVDKAERLLSLCYTDSGGAFSTLLYARKKGLEIISLN